MPHSPHRRRHASSRDADLWLHRIAVWFLLVVVGFLLGALYVRSKPGPVVTVGIGAIIAVVALVGLSYFLGRLAAALRNVCSLHAAHMDLGRFMRTNASFRAARRDAARPKS